MGLTIVVGKKGSGKTAFALHQIEKELKDGIRIIITNMEIYKAKLEQHLRSQGFECDVANRLIVLGAKDRRFSRWWRIRGESERDVYGAFGVDPRWDTCTGILYVVDEGQHHYPARGWSSRLGKQVPGEPSLGEECNDYLCQERKTSDDTIVTTPATSLIDKDFRTLSTECVVLDNWYRKRMRGIKASGRFQVNCYENCPPQQGEEPNAQPHFYLDAEGLMACYNTAAGAGFVGTRADKDKPPARGVHWGWLVAGVGCLAFSGWLALHFTMHKVVGHYADKLAKTGNFNVPFSGVTTTNKSVVQPQQNYAVQSQSRSNEILLHRPSEIQITALTKGVAGWGVCWKEGNETSVSSNVVSLGRNRYLIDNNLCKLVSGGHSNTPPAMVGMATRAPQRADVASLDDEVQQSRPNRPRTRL